MENEYEKKLVESILSKNYDTADKLIRYVVLYDNYDILPILSKHEDVDVISFSIETIKKYRSQEYSRYFGQLIPNRLDVAINRSLCIASEYNCINVLRYLIGIGANARHNNSGSLHAASYNGNNEIIKILVENGADVHSNHDISLMWATRKNHLETVKLLIEAGAYIVSGENNALVYAVKNRNSRIVKFLIEKGADIDDNRSIISEFLSVEKLPESKHSIIDMINAIIIHES
jgi:ankyrin repeat protein